MTYKTLIDFIKIPINDRPYDARIITGFDVEKGSIKKFKIQFLVNINSKWEEIRRCDSAHGIVHVHNFISNHQSETIKIQDINLKKLLKEQKNDFEQNTEKWLINYLLKMQK